MRHRTNNTTSSVIQLSDDDVFFRWMSASDTTSTLGLLLVAVACFVQVLVTTLHPKTCLPQLVSKPSSLSKHLLETVPGLNAGSGRHFRPPCWAAGAHVQTCLAMLLPVVAPQHHLRTEREYLQLKDMGLVALEWTTPSSDQQQLPEDTSILLVIPPIWGYHSLIQSTCVTALSRGFRPLVFHRRGSSGVPLTTARLQSFGDPSDFRQAIRYVRSKWPKARMVIIGFSMGNGLLMSYLGEYGSSAHVSAAVAISPIWDAPSLFRYFPQPYGWTLLTIKKLLVLRHSTALQQVVDLGEVVRSKTFAQLCQALYLPLYGHQDMEEFWDKNNPLRDVDDVAIPLMVIQSSDDPIVTPASIPYELFNVYPNFFLLKTTSGGHCAFLDGDNLNCWAVQVALDYLEAVTKFFDLDAALGNGHVVRH